MALFFLLLVFLLVVLLIVLFIFPPTRWAKKITEGEKR
jgi:cbb3-type cytochrome oxidase subunit 3